MKVNQGVLEVYFPQVLRTYRKQGVLGGHASSSQGVFGVFTIFARRFFGLLPLCTEKWWDSLDMSMNTKRHLYLRTEGYIYIQHATASLINTSGVCFFCLILFSTKERSKVIAAQRVRSSLVFILRSTEFLIPRYFCRAEWLSAETTVLVRVVPSPTCAAARVWQRHDTACFCCS